MSADPSRIGFITNEFRVSTVEDTVTVPGKYGSLARKTTEPIETFFDDIADTAAICSERFALLSQDRRRFALDLQDTDFVDGLTYNATTPAATVVDDERAFDKDCLITAFGIDYDDDKSSVMVWG